MVGMTMMRWINTIRQNLFSSLRVQLFTTFISMSVVILAIGSFYFYYSMIHTLKDKTEEAAMQSFRQAEQSLLGMQGEVDKITKLLLVEDKIQQLLDVDQDIFIHINNIQNLKEILNDILYRYDYIHSIYLFLNTGLSIGDSRDHFYLDQKTESSSNFFTTQAGQSAINQYPKMIWEGNMSKASYDHFFANISKDQTGLSFISAIRGVRSLYTGQVSSAMVINLEKGAFDQLYAEADKTAGSRLYILDRNNSAISGDTPNTEVIRQISSGTLSKNGSHTLSMEGKRYQVIFYPMKSSSWTLVKEVPYEVFTQDVKKLRSVILIMISVSLIIALLLSSLWISRLTRPLSRLIKVMQRVEDGQLGLKVPELGNKELDRVGTAFNKMSVSIQELVETNLRIEGEKRKSEIQVLHQQINPHFLHNTLNVVKWMAMASGALNIVDVLTSLGNMLRPIFRMSGSFLILSEELEYTENYMNIMNYRYGEGTILDIQIEDELMERKVPRFILQPILENSLLHGMKHKYRFRIDIHGFIDPNSQKIVLQVIDYGKGIEPERLADLREALKRGDNQIVSGGIGLMNVHNRIRFHYGEQYGLNIESELNEKTIVTIEIPIMLDLED
jgi:two-component system sensor histidine kinase YesM